MRSGLSTIQQTLTSEAAAVLNQSISEAGRRNHGQTTPLHVASTLLSSPTGFLRQACIRSHPNSSHPLQCRALELCFSVALERLPAAASTAVTEPPISNALMATLKRAQAHQRRGCPEQQQQPLLAVKVELEQLIISILDDPSVSRVMREAGFSSPAVKTALTAGSGGSANSTDSSLPATTSVLAPRNSYSYTNSRLQQQNHQKSGSTFISSSSPINLYPNPRLQQEKQVNPRSNQPIDQRNDDVKRVLEIMTKPKRRNPILVGESEPETIRLEIIRRIQTGQFGKFGIEKPKELNNVEVISIGKEFESMSDKSKIPTKIKELCDQIDKKIGNLDSSKDIIIDVADLKWLVDQPPISSIGRESVSEMAKLVGKFTGKVWLIGTATCETYLRCQVYHQSMEIDWDLQAVPITSRSSIPNLFPRMGTNGVLGSSIQTCSKLNVPFCAKCSSDYEQELAKLKESEKPIEPVKNNLPQWLQNAKPKDQSHIMDKEVVLKQKIQDLQKKWRDECFRIHPNHNPSSRFDRVDRVSPMVVPMTGSYKPNMLLRQSQPQGQPGQLTRLQPAGILQESLQPLQAPRLEAPRSPVRTDLVLGPKKPSETTGSKEDQDLTVKDLLGCISSEPQKGKFANSEDAEYFKRLLKSLMKKAWWQPEAASAVATTITQTKVDTGSRGSVWLLFAGPDRVGKKKMASVLSEHVNGTNPITIALGSRRDDQETDTGFRGKTILDRIVDAVRRNPSSVIVLSDIDEADTLVRGSIKRAMERGRLTDSHGREISLGNVIFILTGNWSTNDVDEHQADEQRLRSLACHDWQLRLAVCNKRYKRRADWMSEKDMSRKQRKELGLDLSLDLNLAIDYEEDRTDGSTNSSNLTVDQEEETQQFAVTCVPRELSGPSDGAVVFKPVNFGTIRREIEKTITNAFSAIVDDKVTIEVDESAVENIMGGLWFGGVSLEEWAEQVLVPSMRQVNTRLPNPGANMVVRLESDRDSVRVGGSGDWLPGKIAVVVDGV